MKGRLSEKQIKEQIFDHINDIELYPYEIEEYKEIDFDLDLDEVKLRFAGKISSYNAKMMNHGDITPTQ